MADKYYNDHYQKVLGIIHHGLSTAAEGLLTKVQATTRVSGGPVSTPTEYSVHICLIRHNGYTILHWVSGGPLRTHTEYCVSVCLIRHNGYTILHCVSSGPLITPTEYCVHIRLI